MFRYVPVFLEILHAIDKGHKCFLVSRVSKTGLRETLQD